MRVCYISGRVTALSMEFNENKESVNKSPAACLIITNQQCNTENQFPRKLTEMDESGELFHKATMSTDCEPRFLDVNRPDCEPRLLDVNGPDVIQNDSGIELEGQILQYDNVNNDDGVSEITIDELEHEMTRNIRKTNECDLQSSRDRFTSQEKGSIKIVDGMSEHSSPQCQKSCPESSTMSTKTTLPESTADDIVSPESDSQSSLTLEAITNFARKMSRPMLQKEVPVKAEDHFEVEHSTPHLAKQTTREFQNRYRPTKSSRQVSDNTITSPRSPRNRGMAYAFSVDDSRLSKKKSNLHNDNGQHSKPEMVSYITAIENQVITNNEMSDEQRALNDITAMTRKATRPTVKDLDLQSPVKVRSKSVAQIKSPLIPALSPVRSPLGEKAPGSAFSYPDNHHEKVRSKSVTHMPLSTNPALSPQRSPISDRLPLSRSSSTSSSSDYSPMNNIPDPCYRCWRTVYPLDKIGPIRKVLFHKLCFKCFECGTSLNLKNYCQNSDDKMDKAVYCKTHQPIVESGHVTLEDRNLNITMNYPKLDSYNSNIRVPHEDRRESSNVRPLSIRGAVCVPKLDIVCGDSLNDPFNNRTPQTTPRGMPRMLDTNGNEFDDQIVETRSRKTAIVDSPRHLSLADDIKLTPVWSRSALNAAHLDIGPVNRNNHHFYSYSSGAWNNL